MTDKVPMPASGNPETKGAPDGVSGTPGDTDGRDVHGRSAGGESGGGESGGGAYPNPHSGKTPDGGGFMGHGGQTDIAYHGGGQSGDTGGSAPNAVAGSHGEGDGGGESGGDPKSTSGVPNASTTTHAVDARGNGGDIAVEESSGTAAAEATGKVGTDAAYEGEQKQPGAG